MNITRCYWHTDEAIGSWPQTNDGLDFCRLPMMMKRRLTVLGQHVIEVLYKATHNQAQIPWVIASRHADTNRKVRLLSSLARKETLSPTDFSMSVHNAIIGAFSIATQNKRMHTAITGSEGTFEAGLLEAFALQKEKKSTIGYLYYDTLLPEQLINIKETDYPIVCLAIVLDEKEEAGQIQLSYTSEKPNASHDFFQDNALTEISVLKGERYIPIDASMDKIKSLLDYLKNNEKTYKISVPGGSIFLERTG